jgi:hypothetical protein
MKAPTTPQFLVSLVVVALLGAVVGAAAAGTPSPAGDRATGSPAANVPAGSSAAPSGAAEATATPAPVVYAGTVAVAPEHGPIGSLVDVTGSGFPADTGLELGWQAFSASWKLDPSDPANYKGREYREELVRLGTMTTDGQGAFRTTFMVPDGFGFAHDVRVLQGGALRNQTTFKVDMEVAVSPKSGPPGTPITIDVKGIGVSSLTRSWLVTYDDHYTGWLSSVTTNGRARAAIPATGGPGAHVLKIVHGSFTFPYLNPNQSPDPTRPTFTEIFTVTAGPPVLPPPAAEQAIVSAATAPRPDAAGPKAWVDRVEATVGQRVILNGADMPASATFDVAWQTQVGVDTQIIGGGGQARPESEWAVGTVTSDAVGAFSLPFEVPVDKGGNHSILVRSGDQVVAVASLRVRPRALPLSAQRGPVGTVITVSLQGVDDTDTGKIFMLVYDNAMLGYSCSVTGQGQITIELPATGVPGWHFIDLYPGIYKGEDLKDVYNYRIPQLTYADDHPGETLPAFRFAFEVTP